MKRRPSPKLSSTAIPSRAEVAAALAAAGLFTSATAHAWPADPQATPLQEAQSQDAQPAPAPAGGDDGRWFPPAEEAPRARPGEGLLTITNLTFDISVFMGEQELAPELLAKGISLPPGQVNLTFRRKSPQPGAPDNNYPFAATIAADGSTVIDAAAIVNPSVPHVEERLGGVPPDDRFTIHGGCCGNVQSTAATGGPSRAPESTAAVAFLALALGARRRKQR